MKKNKKNIKNKTKKIVISTIKYLLTFIFIVLICVILQVIVAKIPKKYFEKNIDESIIYLNKNRIGEFKYKNKANLFSYIHVYADEMILNIIYNLDGNKPLESVMKAEYTELRYDFHQPEEDNIYGINKIKSNSKKVQYIRYWHGSIIILIPLLIFFNIHQIYIIFAIILNILAIILIIMLLKRGQKTLVIAFLISCIMTTVIYVPFCMEYIWTFLIMLIFSIIVIKLEDKRLENNSKFYLTFFICGICTCFFDFLTTEELPILVPLLIILGIRHSKNETNNLKSIIKFVVMSMIVWFIGYCSMWLTKWGLASLILNVNSLDYVKFNALYRLNGNIRTRKKRIGRSFSSMFRNIKILFPLCFIPNEKLFILIPIIYLIILLSLKKEKDSLKIIIPLLIIGLVPYLRYSILMQHSYAHCIFTFRLQFATIMALVMILGYCIDPKKLNKKIYISRKRKNKI